MEELVDFLQVTLSKNFFFHDDFVVEQLQVSMAELRRAKLDLPAPGTAFCRRFQVGVGSTPHTPPPTPFPAGRCSALTQTAREGRNAF